MKRFFPKFKCFFHWLSTNFIKPNKNYNLSRNENSLGKMINFPSSKRASLFPWKINSKWMLRTQLNTWHGLRKNISLATVQSEGKTILMTHWSACLYTYEFIKFSVFSLMRNSKKCETGKKEKMFTGFPHFLAKKNEFTWPTMSVDFDETSSMNIIFFCEREVKEIEISPALVIDLRAQKKNWFLRI